MLLISSYMLRGQRWQLAVLVALFFVAGCKNDPPTATLPDVSEVLKPDAVDTGPQYVIVGGDTIPVPADYSKTLSQLTRLTSLADTVDFVTIHPPDGSTGVWKKFTAAVLKAYVTAALSDSITQHRTEIDGLAAAGVPDGDKGDITVSGSGLVWTIDAGVIGATELASTAVTPGAYTHASITVDADGRITSVSSGTDNDTQLTQEQVEDFIGAMLSTNTETLITVTYQDADGTIDFVVDNDLANYDNTNSAFLTSEVDGSTTNELISGSTYSGDTITITDAGGTQTIVTGAVKAVAGVAPSGSTQTIDLQSKYVGVIQIDLTSASSPLTLTVNNPVDGGVYTFHSQNASSNDVVFPAAFLNADGTSLGTVSYTSDDFLTCYYDGTNYYCK